LWSSGEKLIQASKEIALSYQPQTRQSRLVKIPIVKSIAEKDLAVGSESEKSIYQEIEQTSKRDLKSKRDEW
jgi:hypothetical protein